MSYFLFVVTEKQKNSAENNTVVATADRNKTKTL